jgi:putative phage-type endonuclease
MLTPEQHAIRAQGIPASDVAAVLGLNPWRSPYEVWHEKVDPKVAEKRASAEENPAMRRGRIKESMIVNWYREETGNKVSYAGRHQRTFRSESHPLCIATPDGLIEPGHGVLEVKAPGRYTIGHWGNDECGIPEYYITQVMWQMAATGRKWVHAAVDLGDCLGIYKCDWDQGLFERMYKMVNDFWVNHVLTGEPPPPDPSKGCASVLSELYPEVAKPELAVADDDARDAMLELQAAKIELKAAEERERLASNRIRLLIADGAGLQSEFGKVTWSQTKGKTVVDWKSLAEELGASAESIAKHTSQKDGYRTLRAYWRSK